MECSQSYGYSYHKAVYVVKYFHKVHKEYQSFATCRRHVGRFISIALIYDTSASATVEKVSE